MGSLPSMLRWSAAALALLAAASCSAGTDAAVTGSGAASTAVTGSGAASTAAVSGPLTAEISQFRDQYSQQVIEIQLTNTTGEAVTVLAAGLRSPLFESAINWTSSAAGIELPAGQTKSLDARLPAASCPAPAPQSGQPPQSSRPPQSGQPVGGPGAVVEVRVAHDAGAPARTLTAAAADPFGVLSRNNAEMCLAQAAAAVAEFRLDPGLEVSADARTAVLRLFVTPRKRAGALVGGDGTLVINSIGGTTLLEEDKSAPWPAGLRVEAAGPVHELRLGIRPARCDPHAVAEDKVGTLIPLRVSVAGREGVLKVAAGAQLRGRIYDFVTSACGRQ